MREINNGNTHAVCQEMVASLQTQAQDLIDAIDALVDLVTIVENDHYKCDITSNGDCHLMESDSWQIEYIHGSIRRAKQSIAKAKND